MYKLKTLANPFTDDILDVVCKNRGVEKDKLLNYTATDTIHYSKLLNLDKATQLFKEIINNKKIVSIVIVIDSDPDGYSSATILTNYIEKNFKNVELHFLFHEGKQHGLSKNIMKQINEVESIDLLLVPDAGSNNHDEHKELNDKGIPIIVLDHHEVDKESECAIVVNSQLSPEYNNKQLSGVGIVYKFIKALDDEFKLNDADNYLDLVSLGNVADVMNLTSPETRYYAYKGLTQVKNEYLKEMVFKNIGKYENLYPHTLSFNLIPKMNAIIRFGTLEEKQELFYAMIGREDIYYNSRTKKNETLPQKMTRVGTNVHKRQGDTKKKWIAKFKEKIETEKLDENKFIVITLEEKEKFDNELTGVIAGALTSTYRKPILLLHENKEDGKYSGSLRGVDSVLSDTKGFLLSLGLFEFVEGHSQAAGLSITKENLDKLNESINTRIQFNSSENQIEVDFVVPAKSVNKKLIENVQSYEKHWGKGIEPPLFAITNVETNMRNVKVSTGGMIKWNMNGVDYTQFVADKRLIQYAEQEKTLTLNVIGTLGVNNFLGNVTYQVIVDDFEILNVEDSKSIKSFVW